MSAKEKAIYLRLQGRVKERFKAIKHFLSLENDTEVCRMIINDYYMRNRPDLEPKLRHFYNNPAGLLIADPELDELVQVTNTPTGPHCEHCESNNCKHTRFALTLQEEHTKTTARSLSRAKNQSTEQLEREE